jgi:hypothetical protein
MIIKFIIFYKFYKGKSAIHNHESQMRILFKVLDPCGSGYTTLLIANISDDVLGLN